MKRREFVRSTALLIGSAGLMASDLIEGIEATPADREAMSKVSQSTEGYRFGDFDYGLTALQEKRAKRLHEESIVIEMMFQGPCSYRSLTDEMFADLRKEWDEKGNSSVFLKSLARPVELALKGKLPDYKRVWLESGMTGANIQMADTRQGGHIGRLAEYDTHDWYQQAKVAEDFRRAKKKGHKVSFLNYQSAPDYIDDLKWFEESYAVGIRMIGLTYNFPNHIGVGCTGEDSGLTKFGREAISLMNDLGIIVDTAHAGKRTTLDACAQSKKPVVASHTGREKLLLHDRNKSDDELRAVAGTGGIIGIYAVPFLLSAKPTPGMDAMLDHIESIAELVGIDHVAIGTDWPMQLPKWVLTGPFKKWTLEVGFSDEQVPSPEQNLVGFDDYRDYPNITRGLVKRGFSDSDIEKILGGNALRVFEKVCG